MQWDLLRHLLYRIPITLTEEMASSYFPFEIRAPQTRQRYHIL